MKSLHGLGLCVLLSTPFIGFGQASLAAENIIDDIKITTRYGKQKIYTVCRDAIKEDQWYYMPNELRVAEEVSTGGKVRPKMTILRYQYKDPMTSDNKEGGVLVAAFTYAIEPEAVDQVKQQIMQRKGTSNITLSAIPLNSSSIDFLSASDQFIGNVDAKSVSGISGATSASQEMVISYNLTALGAGVFNALAGSGGGIPIRGNITYNGLSAPCGYAIKGKWNNVYKYFEQNKLYEGRFKFWIFSGGGSSSKNVIRESLNSMQDMDVKVVECPSAGGDSGGSNSDEANMQALIKTIQNEVLSDSMMKRVSNLDKLQAMLTTADPNVAEKIAKLIEAEKKFIQFGYQNSVKDVSKRRTGEITYDFSRQKMIVRPSTIGGLLSFSKYGLDEQKLKDEGYIVDIDANQDFPSVIIGLPNISPDFDLRTITMEVSYKNSEGNTHSEARQWDAAKSGWVTPTNAPVGHIRFNLIGEKDKARASEPEFDVKLQVVSRIPNSSFTIERKIKLSTGERYIDAIELLTKQIIVDGSTLDFSSSTKNNTDLAYAKLVFTKGQLSVNKDIKPYIKDGVAGPPNPVYLLLPNDEATENGKITYTTADGKKIDRTEPLMAGENTLGNYEWKPAGN